MAMVIKPKRKFTAGAPTTSDIVEGEIAINTADKKLYVRDNSNNIVEIGGAAGTTSEITQNSHGFIVKDAIYHNGSTWAKAQANSTSTLALGIVTEKTTNTFVVAQSGRFEISSHGFTAGQWYYLSSSSAGGLTATEPAISQPIVYVESNSVIHIFPYRPTNLLVNGTSSITPGDNTVTTAKIVDDNVTYAKIQNVSATDRVLGRDSSGAGVIEEISPASLRTMINVADGANAYTHPNHSGEVTSTADGATVIASNVVDEDNLKVSNSPTNGYFLSAQSGNTGGLTWAAAGGAYSSWEVIDADKNPAAAGDQIAVKGTTARTITLPSSPSAGDTVIIHNTSTALVTVARNGSNINSTADDGALTAENTTQLVYIDATIGWKEI